jgi:hypothetical protein
LKREDAVFYNHSEVAFPFVGAPQIDYDGMNVGTLG